MGTADDLPSLAQLTLTAAKAKTNAPAGKQLTGFSDECSEDWKLRPGQPGGFSLFSTHL
jgi:hypothetical protein